MSDLNPVEQEILDGMLSRRGDLSCCVGGLLSLHGALVQCYDDGGTLFTCGNGGSHADAVHIVGELCKSFERVRPVPEAVRGKLLALPYGDTLSEHLEAGFRAHALGCNSALKTAIENDSPVRNIAFAQELLALMRGGDVLLALSTSGTAENCRMALSTARAVGGVTAVLTGPDGGAMGREGDIVLKVPGDSVKEIQEGHIVVWHTLCLLVEGHYFSELRT